VVGIKRSAESGITERNVRDYAAGFDYTKISIDILADALNLITFEWIAILRVCRMIAAHSSSRSEYISTEVVLNAMQI
jgi:hypothetical protein